MKHLALGFAAAAAVAIFSGIAYASIPASDGVIHGAMGTPMESCE